MLLYDAPLAPNPRRVRIFLAEKGVSIPSIDVDLIALEQKGDAFTRVNPLQAVPALVLDDGSVLTESLSICRYIERLHPEPPLLGVGAHDEAFVDMWQRRMEFGLFAPVAQAFRHSHPALSQMENPQFPDFAATQRIRALKMLHFLESELATRRFIAGDNFTVADITAIVAVDFCKPARIAIPEDLTHFSRWRQDVSSRPSAQS
jgi:glutathione S-transferase